MKLLQIIPLVELDVIKETLERIGIINKQEKIIFPSCYLLEEDEEYFICHFKELIIKTNEDAFDNLIELDIRRRNSIAILLEDWNMIEILSNEHFDTVFVNILPITLKEEYKVIHKYYRKSNED